MAIRIEGEGSNNNLGDRLTNKLVEMMEDPDINIAMGSYMTQLIAPGLRDQGKITPDQMDTIISARRNTLEGLLNPDQLAQAQAAVQTFSNSQDGVVEKEMELVPL